MINIKCNSCGKPIEIGYERCSHKFEGVRGELHSYIDEEGASKPLAFVFSIEPQVMQFNTTNMHFCKGCFLDAIKRGIAKHSFYEPRPTDAAPATVEPL